MKVLLGSLLGLVGANAFFHNQAMDTRDKFQKLMQHRFQPVETLDLPRRRMELMRCASIEDEDECEGHAHCLFRGGSCVSVCSTKKSEKACNKVKDVCMMDMVDEKMKCVTRREGDDTDSMDTDSKEEMEAKDLLIRVVVEDGWFEEGECTKHSDVHKGYMAFNVKWTDKCQEDPNGGEGSFMMRCGEGHGSLYLRSYKRSGCKGAMEETLVNNDSCKKEMDRGVKFQVLYHWDPVVTRECGMPDKWGNWPQIDPPKDDVDIGMCGIEIAPYITPLFTCALGGNFPVEGVEQKNVCDIVSMGMKEGEKCVYSTDVIKCQDKAEPMCQYKPPGACLILEECKNDDASLYGSGTWLKCIGRDCPKIDYGWVEPPRIGGSGSGSGMMECPFDCMGHPMCPCRMHGPCDGMMEYDDPMEFNGGRCMRDSIRYCCEVAPYDMGCMDMPMECEGSGSGSGSGSGYDDEDECPFYCRMWPEEHQHECPCTWIMDETHVCYGIHESEEDDPRGYNDGKCWPTIQQYCCDAEGKDPMCDQMGEWGWVSREKCRDQGDEEHMVGIGYVADCDKPKSDQTRDTIYLMKTSQCQRDPTREDGYLTISCDYENMGIVWTAYADEKCEEAVDGMDGVFPVGKDKCYEHPFEGLDMHISIEKFRWEFFCGLSDDPFTIGTGMCEDGHYVHMIEYKAEKTEECQLNTNLKNDKEYLKIQCSADDTLVVGIYSDKDCSTYKDDGEGDITLHNRKCMDSGDDEPDQMFVFDYSDFCGSKTCDSFESKDECKAAGYCKSKGKKKSSTCTPESCKKFRKKLDICEKAPHCDTQTKTKKKKKPKTKCVNKKN